MTATKIWLASGEQGIAPFQVAKADYDANREYKIDDGMDGRAWITPGDDLLPHVGKDNLRLVVTWEGAGRWNQQTPVRLYVHEDEIEPKRGRLPLVIGQSDWFALLYQQLDKPNKAAAGTLVNMLWMISLKVGGGPSVIPRFEMPLKVRL